MNVMTRRRPSLLCAALLIAQIPAAAQGPPPQLPPPDVRPMPESAQEFARTLPWDTRAAEAGPVRRLGARDVVALAMLHNLDIVIERYNQQVAAQRVVAARGAYDPALSLNAALTSVTNPLTGASGGAEIPTEHLDIGSVSPGVRQLLPGGATASVAVASTRTRTSSTLPVLNPVVATSLTAAVTPPLLRGFLATSADRQIDRARLDAELAASLYRQRLTSIVQQVLALYWELQYAIRVHDTRRQSKDLAIVQYDATRMRVQNGLLPPVALTAARAEIASRERDVLQAEVQIIGAENGLKLLISQDPSSSIWNETLLPVDDPAAEPAVPTYREALDRATAGRPELEQLRLQLEQNAVDRRFFKRETLPTVNLTASLTSSGRSGVALLKVNGLGTEDPTNPSNGGFQRSWRQAFGFAYPGWGLALAFQMPIGNRSAEAVYQQATLVRGRLDTQRTKLLQAVMVDVRNALQVISTQRKSLEAARLTTQLFAEQLEGQTARYTAGFSNDFELRRYQRDLVDARVKELRALVDLQLAVISLQRATDTLLEASGAAPPR
jgi:outer membrane protein TolC